jgi:putative acetyltransferase
MFVLDSARGRGLAGLLLAALEEHALANAIGVIQLETGEPQAAAIALYEKQGYRRIPRFGQYVDDPTSVCMEKILPR